MRSRLCGTWRLAGAEMTTRMSTEVAVGDERVAVRLLRLSHWLRVGVAGVVVLAIFLAGVGYLSEVVVLAAHPVRLFGMFRSVLDGALLLLIAVELLYLIWDPTPARVVHLLVVMIAREMLLQQRNGVNDLLGVLGIGVLFAVRRYLVQGMPATADASPEQSAEIAVPVSGPATVAVEAPVAGQQP